MAIIGIVYTDGNYYDENENIVEIPVKYSHVYLYLSSDEEFIFNSGDFVKDWFWANKKFLEVHQREMRLSMSSSVDQFIMDGAPFDSAYLIFPENSEKGELTYKFEEKSVEIFVHKGTTPTWEEYKKYCKS